MNLILVLIIGVIVIYFHIKFNIWLHNKIIEKYPHLKKCFNSVTSKGVSNNEHKIIEVKK